MIIWTDVDVLESRKLSEEGKVSVRLAVSRDLDTDTGQLGTTCSYAA